MLWLDEDDKVREAEAKSNDGWKNYIELVSGGNCEENCYVNYKVIYLLNFFVML